MRTRGDVKTRKRTAAELAALPPDMAIIRQKELLHLLGISGVTLWRWQRAGWFPRPDLRVGGVVGWRPETIRAFLSKNSKR
jgi:predicted DNA-binding transcriptional regulator AlpA